jgi:GT2 family glycosyltransferase
VGGFHSVDFDDLDLCLRLAAAYPGHYLMYEPRAVVYHHVPADRVSWQYFWRRPYYVNKAKVEAFTSMGGAANLAAELHFVTHAITRGTLLELKDVLRGDPYAFARMGAMLLGIGLAGVGHVAGRIEQYWRVAPSYN